MSNQERTPVCITNAEQNLLNFFTNGIEAKLFKKDLMRLHDYSSEPLELDDRRILFKTKMLADAIFELRENKPN